MDLERILHSQGFGSRRQCRALILAGRVTLDARPCTDPATTIDTAGLTLNVDGVDWLFRDKVYVALHKPAGYECSRAPQHHPSVFDLLPAPLTERGVQCAGRLDQDTTGLLLLSDDGQFVHASTSPRRKVPKVYRMRTAEPVSDAQRAQLLAGVLLRGETARTAALDATLDADGLLRLTIAEGKYHQVKRMLAAVGNRVTRLHREAVGGWALPDGLAPGQWMWLGEAELACVLAAL